MNYEEVQEILKAKNAIGYPRLYNIRQNQKYANLLYDSFAGSRGELSAICQYIYEHIELECYENISQILLAVAKEEMKHLDMIGGLIKRLGRRPMYMDNNKKMWDANHIRCNFNSIYEMMCFNIKTEQEAIKEYKNAIKFTRKQEHKRIARENNIR